MKQPFFVDPAMPGYVRGGPFDKMGGMLVGLHAKAVCKRLNDHDRMVEALKASKVKLEKLFDATGGVYHGGMEHSQLMKMIDSVITGPE